MKRVDQSNSQYEDREETLEDEYYDQLNSETFGNNSEDDTNWEEQHESYIRNQLNHFDDQEDLLSTANTYGLSSESLGQKNLVKKPFEQFSSNTNPENTFNDYGFGRSTQNRDNFFSVANSYGRNEESFNNKFSENQLYPFGFKTTLQESFNDNQYKEAQVSASKPFGIGEESFIPTYLHRPKPFGLDSNLENSFKDVSREHRGGPLSAQTSDGQADSFSTSLFTKPMTYFGFDKDYENFKNLEPAVPQKLMTVDEVEKQMRESLKIQESTKKTESKKDTPPKYTILQRNASLPTGNTDNKNQQQKTAASQNIVPPTQSQNVLPQNFILEQNGQYLNQGCRPKQISNVAKLPIKQQQKPKNGHYEQQGLRMRPPMHMGQMRGMVPHEPMLPYPHQRQHWNPRPPMPLMGPMPGHPMYMRHMREYSSRPPGRFMPPGFPVHPPYGPMYDNYGLQQQSDHDERRRQSASSQPFDEYAGLMTESERNFILRIQMTTLKASNPDQSDYYYRTYKQRQQGNSRNRMQKSEQEFHSKSPANVYTPLQFENSLGRLQVGSVNAPRKIIDMPAEPNEPGNNSTEPERDKHLLLSIENLYIDWMKAVEEHKENQNLPDELKCTKKKETLEKNFLPYTTSHTKLAAILSISKGKEVVTRILPFLGNQDPIIYRILKELNVINKKKLDDSFLVILPITRSFVKKATEEQVIEVVQRIELKFLLSNKFSVSVVADMLHKVCDPNGFGSDPITFESDDSKEIWKMFLQQLCTEVKNKKKEELLETPVIRITNRQLLEQHLDAMDVHDKKVLLDAFCNGTSNA